MSARIDESGNRYGALVVLEHAGRSKYRKTLWKVKCDCGVEKEVAGEWLRDGRVTSCSTSCPRRPGRKSVAHRCTTSVQASYRYKALQASREWALSFEDVFGLIFSPCYWCGSAGGNTFEASCTYNGIDRMDNTRGYVKGNAVACCGDCNYLKQEWEVQKWLQHMSKIMEKHGNASK